jgi:hypothetical protein
MFLLSQRRRDNPVADIAQCRRSWWRSFESWSALRSQVAVFNAFSFANAAVLEAIQLFRRDILIRAVRIARSRALRTLRIAQIRGTARDVGLAANVLLFHHHRHPLRFDKRLGQRPLMRPARHRCKRRRNCLRQTDTKHCLPRKITTAFVAPTHSSRSSPPLAEDQ